MQSAGVSRTASIPRGWERVPLEQIAEVRLGRQRSPERAHGKYMRPYMRAANVTWAGIDVADVKEMDFTPDEAETYELKDGDILLSEASGSPSEVGKPALWRSEIPGACFQNTLIRVRADQDIARYLHSHFVHDAVTGLFAQASRGVGIHHLGAQAMSEWKTTVPPLAEQRRIVEALDSYLTRLDAATEGLKRVEANLKRYRASVLKAAVEGHLVPTEAELAKKEKREFEPASVLLERILKERRHRWEQAELVKMKTKGEVPRNDTWKDKYEEPSAPDTSELPELPEGWCWTSLGQLSLSVRNGISTPPNETDGVPILRISAVRALSLNLEDIRYLPNNPTAYQGFELETGDLLFTRYNGNPALVGACARVPEGAGGIYYPDKLIRVRPVSGTLVCSEFAELAAAAGASRDHLSRWTKTTAGQAGISGADVKKMPLPFAPLLEQERVADAVSDAWSVASNASHSVAVNLAHLTRLRQSILRWAFEGKLVDQNPKDEPASVLLERIRGERESSQPVRTPKPERARRKTA